MEAQGIIGAIGRIRRLANDLIIKELEKRGISGLSTSHGDILALLANGDRIPMSEISRRIDRKKNTVTVLVNKLIRLGYVHKQKSPSDSRVTLIFLTEKGRRLMPDFWEISNLLLEKTYTGFSSAEQSELVRLLTRVIGNLALDDTVSRGDDHARI